LPIYTDTPEFAAALFGPGDGAAPGGAAPDPAMGVVAGAFLGTDGIHVLALDDPFWRHAVVSRHSSGSQYERLIGLVRQGASVPHGLACVARTGSGFQGFRGRSWQGCAGNLHLTVHLAPGCAIRRFESVFLALAAVSVVDAIDEVPGLRGRAGIKWVNDVLIAGAKVAGVLAHTQTRGATVGSVVLGIGINVETRPEVAPTPFVPRAASLRDHAPEPASVGLREVLSGVLRSLERNFRLLLSDGYHPLVERYRARSVVIDEEVEISADEADGVPRILRSGRVERIGDGLELWLAGQRDPVVGGRLILARDPDRPEGGATPRANRGTR
jgi:BirA family transcriptional regulator, biotin operon repressor / biotin---[acetyl-CoA-carboxylase] ligase